MNGSNAVSDRCYFWNAELLKRLTTFYVILPPSLAIERSRFKHQKTYLFCSLWSLNGVLRIVTQKLPWLRHSLSDLAVCQPPHISKHTQTHIKAWSDLGLHTCLPSTDNGLFETQEYPPPPLSLLRFHLSPSLMIESKTSWAYERELQWPGLWVDVGNRTKRQQSEISGAYCGNELMRMELKVLDVIDYCS